MTLIQRFAILFHYCCGSELFVIFSGGILEPEGTVEIKFRYKDLSKAMHRLDPICVGIKEQLMVADLQPKDKCILEKQMKEREEQLMPIYHQVAVMFADLHDTANRMQEKGCINVSLCCQQSTSCLDYCLRETCFNSPIRSQQILLRALKAKIKWKTLNCTKCRQKLVSVIGECFLDLLLLLFGCSLYEPMVMMERRSFCLSGCSQLENEPSVLLLASVPVNSRGPR